MDGPHVFAKVCFFFHEMLKNEIRLDALNLYW